MSQPPNLLGVTITAVDTTSGNSVSLAANGQAIAVTGIGFTPAKWDVLFNPDQTFTIKVTDTAQQFAFLAEGATTITIGPTATTWERVPSPSSSSNANLFAVRAKGTFFYWVLTSTAAGQPVTASPAIPFSGGGGTVGLWLFA